MTDRDLTAYGRPKYTLRSRFLKGYRLELRPASAGAPDKTVTFFYRRDGDVLKAQGVGSLNGGEWKNSKGKPVDPDGLYWVEMVAER